MRLTDLFTRTLRDAPGDADMANHRLAIRAGLVRPVAAGIYALMPLGLRVIRKIEGIIRAEMDRIDGQEVRLPVVQPASVWQATGRWESFGPVLQKFASDSGRDYALGTTAEDVLAVIATHEIASYKQLPQHVYQIHTKYRSEPRPRGGLIRLREFTMKDSYSFDADEAGLDVFYERMVAAYRAIFEQVGLDVVAVEADTGAMGGRASHEFVMAHDEGEAAFVTCDACDYAANVEAARFTLPAPELVEPAPVAKVATPDCTTIQDVADFLGVTTAQTIKAVFFVQERHDAPARFVFVVIRGDLDVNEVKLANALGGGELRAATDDEIRATGAEPGYASPIGLADVLVVADRSVQAGANFVTGANADGYHLTGVNVPRDFAPDIVTDLAEPFEGAICARCAEGRLHLRRAIELGHCFKLGTRYSDAVDLTYLDANGAARPVVMGSYGIGLERVMAAIIEAHHDDYGIIWPRRVAPFDVHIVTLGNREDIIACSVQLYDDLRAAGVDVLLDDRQESAGIKFTDADLIGVPLRLTVSKRSLAEDAVEVKRRAATERFTVPLDRVMAWVCAEIEA